VWSNDASYNNRRRYGKSGEKNTNRDDNKKDNAAKPRIISNDYKPVYDKTAAPANRPPKREKLSWYERLGFKTKKKRTDGNA
ncbi:MAG: hypothetical protein HY965_02470, partial [Ignavibacteriales bacterium]|nr:hypothetical protein [Ignavibacteriales bacterium]